MLEVENKQVLVGAGTDGATENAAEQNGWRGIMQCALPWLFWSWCFAHRLKLACSNALTSPLFCRQEEMLLHLFYIYNESPKRSKELVNIVDDLQEVFELKKRGGLPIRSHAWNKMDNAQAKGSSARCKSLLHIHC